MLILHLHCNRAIFAPLLPATLDGCLNVVIGTKLDLAASQGRAVDSADGRTLAAELNATKGCQPYFETSSLTGENVEEVFEFIFKTCLPQNDSEKPNSLGSSVRLDGHAEKTKSSCC